MMRLAFSRWAALGIVFMVLDGLASAQPTQPNQTNQPNAHKVANASPAATSTANNWNTLTESQKAALAPLKHVWVRITPVKKQKWLDIAVGYHLLSAEGQATLHFRMTEWAALSTKQREQARLNFAQTKKLTLDDKQTKWQAYQALSAEEKQKLASMSRASPPTGAAPALKPVAKDKLITTPQINNLSLKSDANKTPSRAIIVNPAAPAAATAPKAVAK